MIRLGNDDEFLKWDKLVLQNPDQGNVLQGALIGEIKSATGWKNQHLRIKGFYVSILEKSYFILGNFWYIPKGPGVSSIAQLEDVVNELIKIAKKSNVFLIKIEPEILKTHNNLEKIKKLGLYSGIIQPNTNTIKIQIQSEPQRMLESFSQRARRYITKARKEGVEISDVEPTDSNCKIMLNLYKETMSGKGTLLRDDKYYFDFWKKFYKVGQGRLFIAYDKKIPIAGAYILLFGKKAIYKDGGSVREKSIQGASHALQWAVMEWLSKRGFEDYDLCGSPPQSEIENKSHPHYGLGLFKTSFNKNVTEYIGVYDIVVDKFKYKLWNKVIYKLIKKFYRYVLKKPFY